MKKTVIYGIFGILIILLASCSKEEQVATVVESTEAEPIYAVTVTKAIQGELKDYLEFGGDVSAKIKNDTTLVPLRAISEAFECEVCWYGETKTIRIYSPEKQ